MAGLGLEGVTLAIIIGALAAIIYSMRMLVLLERRIARMDENLIRITQRLMKEEFLIEKRLGVSKASNPARKHAKGKKRRK